MQTQIIFGSQLTNYLENTGGMSKPFLPEPGFLIRCLRSECGSGHGIWMIGKGRKMWKGRAKCGG
jgi:hypothetical protein